MGVTRGATITTSQLVGTMNDDTYKREEDKGEMTNDKEPIIRRPGLARTPPRQRANSGAEINTDEVFDRDISNSEKSSDETNRDEALMRRGRS